MVLHLAANNPSYHEKNYEIFFNKNFLTLYIFYSTFEANKKNGKYNFNDDFNGENQEGFGY